MKLVDEKFKDMSAKEKLSYIWDYYKVPIILGVILIYCISTFIYGRITAKQTVFRLALIDSNMTNLTEGSMIDDFASTCSGFDPDRQQMILDAGYNLSDPGFGGFTTEQRLLAEYSAGSIDATIAPKEEIERLALAQSFVDLTEALPTDLMDEINSRDYELLFNKYEDPATGEIYEYPFAVNISKSPVIQAGFTESTGDNLSYYNEDCYYAICPNAANFENSLAFLRYLMS